MNEPMTATELRTRIYRVLDDVIATGRPQLVLRGGRLVRIEAESSPATPRLDLDRLPRRSALACTPDELIETTWADAWSGEAP